MAPSRTQKPSIILCSGAWHTLSHIQPVIPHFENAGYRIVPHALASAGQRKAWDEDVESLHSTIAPELQNGHDVCLILHSAAGMSGAEVLNLILAENPGAKDQIVRVIFLASFIKYNEADVAVNDHLLLDTEQGISYYQKAHHGFFNDVSEAEAQPYVDALTWQNMYALPDIAATGAWRQVPLTYLICTVDNTVPLRVQEQTAATYGMETVRMNAGHCPFVTQPATFVSVVDSILRS